MRRFRDVPASTWSAGLPGARMAASALTDMLQSVRIEAELFDLAEGPGVVLGVHRVGEQELGAPFRAVRFERQGDGASDQDAALALLGDH